MTYSQGLIGPLRVTRRLTGEAYSRGLTGSLLERRVAQLLVGASRRETYRVGRTRSGYPYYYRRCDRSQSAFKLGVFCRIFRRTALTGELSEVWF